MRTNPTTRHQEPEQEDTRPPEDTGDGYPDMARVCRILARQVETLDAMVRHVHRLAMEEDGPTEDFERLSRLALRAQFQTVRTAVALHLLRPPANVEEVPDPDEEEFIKAVMGLGFPPASGFPASPDIATPVEWETGEGMLGQGRSFSRG